nr:MAG TPA: hypothetical protein [Caudoviricetes sp.]
MKLGIYGIALPFENPDKIITETIQEITIPTFSIYLPLKDRLVCDVHQLQSLEKRANWETYLLPEMPNKKILSVTDVSYDESMLSGLGYWGGTIPMVTSSIVSQSILANASSQLTREMIPKITFDYMQPRQLRLYNLYNSCKIVIDMNLEHHKSLASIPDTAREAFMKLALLDVEMMLYNVMKHYNEIETSYGRINLHIEDWQNAEQERQDLLNDWDDRYQLDQLQLYYI